MAPPIYFFPKITTAQLAPEGRLAKAVLEPRGLVRTFADVEKVQEDAMLEELAGAGPGGSSGCLFMAMPKQAAVPVRVGYHPDFQEWTRFRETEKDGVEFWVAIDKEHPPTPGDLARKTQFDGYEISLAGHAWTIPVVRNPEGGTGLARDWILEADGQVSERIQAEYLSLWNDFAGVTDLFFDPDHPSPAGLFQLDRAEALARALQAVAINYRVGRAEQNLLRLINAENWATILAATVDAGAFWEVYVARQAEKKRRRLSGEARGEEAATSTGSQEDSPDTDPAEGSSS